METWFAKSAKATLKYSRKAIDRVSESTSEGAKWGGGESKENSGDGSVLGTIFGGALGAVYGIGRAAVGVPKDITRNRSKKRFEHGITVWGPREKARCWVPLAPNIPSEQLAVRVVCVRHGHARHNDLGGAVSMGNRDAELTYLGIEQSRASGEILKDMEFDLVVVSPYRRCLETAAILLGPRAKDIPHEIQPLAGEHNGGSFENDDLNLIRSAVARGDLGSEKEVLMGWFPASEYPQYQRGFALLAPQWWEHFQASGYETSESFAQRAVSLRNWLGSLAPSLWARQPTSDRVPRILLVSHGGILRQTFDSVNRHEESAESKCGKFQNCEFRVYDVCQGGYFAPPPLPEGYIEPPGTPNSLAGSVSVLPPSPAASAPVLAPHISGSYFSATDPVPPPPGVLASAPSSPPSDFSLCTSSPHPACPLSSPQTACTLSSSFAHIPAASPSSSSSYDFSSLSSPPSQSSLVASLSHDTNRAQSTPQLPALPPPVLCSAPSASAPLPLLYRLHSPLALSPTLSPTLPMGNVVNPSGDFSK